MKTCTLPHVMVFVIATVMTAVSVRSEEFTTAEHSPVNSSIDLASWNEHLGRLDLLETELTTLRERFDSADLAGPEADTGCDLVCPGWNLNADILNWRMRRRGLDFAITTDDTALAVGGGDVQNLSFGRDAGIRTGISYTTKTGWVVGFGYTHFDTDANASAVAPAGGNMWATRSHPNQNEEALTANAFGELDYDVFDLEVRRWMPLNRFAAIQLLGGLRWADIDQGLRFEYDGDDFANAVIDHPVNMTGFGVRLGAAGYWQLPRGISLFTQGAGTVAYGKFNTRLRETNLAGADTIVNVTDSYQQAVPVLEASVGAAWSNDRLEFKTGYELTNWFGLADRSMFVDSVHEGAYAPQSVDLLLEGFFFSAAMTY